MDSHHGLGQHHLTAAVHTTPAGVRLVTGADTADWREAPSIGHPEKRPNVLLDRSAVWQMREGGVDTARASAENGEGAQKEL